jgi:hypothetical protein
MEPIAEDEDIRETLANIKTSLKREVISFDTVLDPLNFS